VAAPQRVAVLIDCDNISHQLCSAIFEETAQHGTLGIKRAYGDWASDNLSGWRAKLPIHALQPIQQFAYTVRKNATDSALIIDAMDLLYSGNVDVFCLVSSDSDFTRLAMRLRESGKTVYGIGAKTTPKAFQNACDRFTYTEVLGEGMVTLEPGSTSVVTSVKRAHDLDVPTVKSVITPAVTATARDDGWAHLGAVGHHVVNQHPSFDSRNYGFPKLGILVRKQSFLEVKDVPLENGMTQVWVRLRAAGQPAKKSTKKAAATRR